MKLLKKFISTIYITTLFLAMPSVAVAQDLLARQAPVDKKAKVLSPTLLKEIEEKEYSGLPAEDLYEDWNNVYAHRQEQLPEKLDIDLRGFCMPTVSRAITSNFGPRWGRAHKGIDLKVYIGDTIRAAFDGKVRMVKYEARGYGKYVVIRHHNGLETIYGHMSKQLVRENEEVKAGDPIGLGGNTGRSTGSHLHFETRLCGIALNPAIFFDFRAQDVTCDVYKFRKSSYMKESAEANRLRGKIGNGGYTPEMVRGKESAKVETKRTTPTFSERKYHMVEPGETLYSISRKRGVSVSKLCSLNNLSKDYKVKAGSTIRYE